MVDDILYIIVATSRGCILSTVRYGFRRRGLRKLQINESITAKTNKWVILYSIGIICTFKGHCDCWREKGTKRSNSSTTSGAISNCNRRNVQWKFWQDQEWKQTSLRAKMDILGLIEADCKENLRVFCAEDCSCLFQQSMLWEILTDLISKLCTFITSSRFTCKVVKWLVMTGNSTTRKKSRSSTQSIDTSMREIQSLLFLLVGFRKNGTWRSFFDVADSDTHRVYPIEQYSVEE